MISDFIFQSAHRAYAAEFAAAQSGEPAAAVHAAALREAIARAFLAKLEEEQIEEKRRKDAVDAKLHTLTVEEIRKTVPPDANRLSYIVAVRRATNCDLTQILDWIKSHEKELGL
jgi:hypothetical protein